MHSDICFQDPEPCQSLTSSAGFRNAPHPQAPSTRSLRPAMELTLSNVLTYGYSGQQRAHDKTA